MSDEEIEIDWKKIAKNKYFWPIIIGTIFLMTRLPLINTYQTFWWDEAQYMLMTKSLFQGTPTTGWWEGRSIIYPWMLRVITFPGFNELAIKFVNILFGLGFVLSSYYLIKELFGKDKAILVSLIMIGQWVFLYWSPRITIDIPSAFLLTLSAYLFIKGENNPKINLLSGVVLGLAFNIRFTVIIAGIIYLGYNMIRNKTKLKDYYWILGVLIGFMPLMIYDTITNGNPIHSAISFVQFNLESSGGSQAGNQYYYLATMLDNYGILMGITVFIGLIPLIFKLKNKKILFTMLSLGVYLLFYSFITSVKEARFLIHLLPFLAVTALFGASIIINTIVKNKRMLVYGLIIVTMIILLENVPIAQKGIENTASSYNDVRLAGEFLKNYEGKVMSNSIPQITYYSEKETDALPADENEFLRVVSNYSFVIVSGYEQHPVYALTLNHSFIKPLKAYPDPQNARLIIYYVNAS